MWPRKIHCMENTEWGDPLWYKKGKSKENTRKTKQKQKNMTKKIALLLWKVYSKYNLLIHKGRNPKLISLLGHKKSLSWKFRFYPITKATSHD